MTKTVIIGDVHGHQEALEALYDAIEVPRDPFDRGDEWHTIQVGDWLHLGHGENEVDFYENTRSYVDEHLLGNHELPAVIQHRSLHFSGYSQRDVDAEKAFQTDWARGGKWKVSTTLGKWFISHAGIHPYYLDLLFHGFKPDPLMLTNYIRSTFNQVQRGEQHLVISGIGYQRGGSSMYGGVFWNDWRELEKGYNTQDDEKLDLLPHQIVGHTPGRDIQRGVGKIINVDVGAKLSGKLSAIVTEDNGESFSDYTIDLATQTNQLATDPH